MGVTGKPLSDEHRAAIREGMRRKLGTASACSVEACERPPRSKGLCPKHYMRLRTHGDPLAVFDQRGAANPNWKGVGATYEAAHQRARVSLPKACALADASCKGQLEASFRWHDTPAEHIIESANGPYSADLNHFWRLCRSHHVRYDHRTLSLGSPS